MLSKQDKKTNQEIITKLKKLRLEKSWTQADIAQKAGINSNYYSKVERGEAIPSIINQKENHKQELF